MKLMRPILVRSLGLAALAVTLVAAWPGCKENSAPTPRPAASALPELHALPAVGDPMLADPLSNPVWRGANWSTLTAPLNDTRTPPTTRTASLYQLPTNPQDPKDAGALYIAFVCADPEITANAATNEDTVEVWLDTSSALNGTEVFCITATPTGPGATSWYRATLPPAPKDDGAPNLAQPISKIPNYLAPGVMIHTGRGQLDGRAAWTAVFKIPLTALPLPLRTVAKEGARWRANLVRCDWITKTGQQREMLQSNFSPVYPACQQISPYRMAVLILDSGNSPVARGN